MYQIQSIIEYLPPVTKKYDIVTIMYTNIADGFFNHDGRFKRRFGTSRILKGRPYKDSIVDTCPLSIGCSCGKLKKLIIQLTVASW